MFKLEKDYIDLIDADGNCFIVYWAVIRVAGIPIRYAGCIFSDAKGNTQESSRLFVSVRPDRQNKLNFKPHGLSLEVKALAIDKEIISNLYTNAEGKVLQWHCHHPKAEVNIHYQQKQYDGLGYAETIVIPMAPWKIPISQLRWGRFLSAHHTLVWIQWRGVYPLNKIWLNGTLHDDALITDEEITFKQNTCKLVFQTPVLIRLGKLEKVISKYPWLRVFFTQRILHTLETKYKAASDLYISDELPVSGWSLYETVILSENK